jgi:hypothetical protein
MILFLLRVILTIVWIFTICPICVLFSLLLWDLEYNNKGVEIFNLLWNIKY